MKDAEVKTGDIDRVTLSNFRTFFDLMIAQLAEGPAAQTALQVVRDNDEAILTLTLALTKRSFSASLFFMEDWQSDEVTTLSSHQLNTHDELH